MSSSTSKVRPAAAAPQVVALRWWSFPPLRNALGAAALALAVWIGGWYELLPRRVEVAGFVAAIAVGGWYWARESLATLWHERAIDIGILMIAATVGAALLGLWDEAAALVVLFALAEGVEEYTQESTRQALRGLMDLVPEQACVVDGGVERLRPARELTAGMRLKVRPGERVPTDGRVLEGRSSLNQAPVTGESLPVAKEPGDEVFAGSVNGEGLLLIEATRDFADNSIARIIHLVESAQEQKGRAQQWIERFGRRYTPAVLAVAALLVLIPWIAGAPLAFWAGKAIVLLVAAAPCALVIATPIAMAAGIRHASRRGILIKGGVHLEHLATVRGVAFDKTGTLTVGAPRLVAFRAFEGAEDTALAVAAGLEEQSRHPLALAVVEAARERGIGPFAVTDFAAMNGNGITGRIDGVVWYIANARWFAQQQTLSDTVLQAVREHQEAGRTVSLLGTDAGVEALLAMADTPRAEAREAIRQLHALGLKLVLLSGDHAITARAIAADLGIDDARGDLKPEDKVAAIQALEREHGPMLMIGDGVNDAPALAAATCGIAMGAAGSDAALEAADVALMSEDLRRVALAVRIGQHAGRVSRQNLVLSIGVLVAMIPAAVLGWIGITTAVIVHEVAELLAVANGVRAGRAPEDETGANASAGLAGPTPA